MTGIIIPSTDADKKRIKDCMDEISNSYLRQEAERSFVKEALSSLAEDVDIPKKYLGKMSRIYHKQNMAEVVSEIEDLEALMESVNKT
jgi:putative transposon-encoded protein